MNYEVIDSPRRIAQQDQRDQHAAQAELAMYDDFIAACKTGEVNARCEWAPLSVNFEDGKYTRNKVQNLADVMDSSLDYTGGPTSAELMSLLCAVAYGTENNQKRAQTLIGRMAATFARFNAEEA